MCRFAHALPLVCLTAVLAAATGDAHAVANITEFLTSRPAQARIGEPVAISASGLTTTSQLFFSSGGADPNLEATQVVIDTVRGILLARVPAGAVSGNVKIFTGLNSNLYYFRVQPGTFTQGTRSVSGRITSGGNGDPNVIVLLLGGSQCGDTTIEDYTQTDANGDYTLHGGDGDHVVQAFPPTALGLASQAGSVTLSSTPATLDLDLVAGTTVTGKVVDKTTPATVIPRASVSANSSDVPSIHEQIYADSQGSFSIRMMPGDWTFDVLPPPGDAHASLTQTFTISGASDPLGNLLLGAGLKITGTLTQSGGAVLSSARVSAVDFFNPVEADHKITGGDGKFTLVVSGPSTYSIEATFGDRAAVSDARVAPVNVGADVTQNLSAPLAALVTGAATDTFSGLPIACLSIVAQGKGVSLGIGAATTRTDGSYVLRLKPDAAGYTVSTSRRALAGSTEYASKTWNGAPGGTWFSCEGTAVTASTAGVTTSGIDFVLPPAAVIEGRISDATCANDLGVLAPPVTIDDGTDHDCSMGEQDFDFAGPGYHVDLVPPTDGLRACVFDPFDFYLPRCWNGKTPPNYDPLSLAPGSTVGNVDFCLTECTQLTWHADGDHDNFGDPNDILMACNQPNNYVSNATDCDDFDQDIHPGAPERCNNLDDDCDGTKDGQATTCGLGACQSAGTCTAGLDSCTPGAAGTEICDNIDNDCDGVVDDGNPGGGAGCTTGQQGVCAAGTMTCTGGALSCARNVDPSAEVCDNLDNDCNGSVDGFATTCGIGACASSGACVAGVDSCLPGAGSAEICNNVDDDCNGQTDEGNPGGGGACNTGQMGVCAAGTTLCAGGTLTCAAVTTPTAEICDNLDNDCDGNVDGFATACGIGGCASTGACLAGVDSCLPGMGSAEVCNNVDDDCDGQTDELLGSSTCGAGACQRTVQNCSGGVPQTCVPGAPGTETCNGVDDDCDGQIDDGLGSSTCGVGACQRTVQNCSGGAPQTCAPGAPGTETCNNVDDDCDGSVDDGNPGGGTACSTGLDGICGTGAMACSSGALICVQTMQPRAETCNNLDDDCNGLEDDTGGACTLFLTSPVESQALDCAAGAVPPTVTWSPGPYDRYRVYVAWDPSFAGTKRISSGDTPLKTTQWTLPNKKWKSLCAKANPSLWFEVMGIDDDANKRNPAKRLTSAVVTVTVTK